MGLLSLSIVVPLGLLFLFSGLGINVIQVLTLIFLLPISQSAYRKANVVLMELLWSELVWLMDWWAGVQIRLYVDSESWSHFGKEHALVISNHRSDLDWLFGWVLAQRVGCLGSTRAVMKKSTKYLPVMGWSMWFSEYIFLERSWAKDEETLKSSFKSLKGFPQPFWMALFVEGTRFTEAKLQQAQEFAASSGLPSPRNVLIPRTKGFVAAVSNLREFVPAVYDVTVAVPKESPPPTMTRALNGQSFVVHLHIRRVLTSALPQSEDGLSQWCKDTFILKDDLLDKHNQDNTFGEEMYKPIRRPVKPLLVVSLLHVHVCIVFFPFQMSTWSGCITGGFGLVITAAVCHGKAFETFTFNLGWHCMGNWRSWHSVFLDAGVHHIYSIRKVLKFEEQKIKQSSLCEWRKLEIFPIPSSPIAVCQTISLHMIRSYMAMASHGACFMGCFRHLWGFQSDCKILK